MGTYRHLQKPLYAQLWLTSMVAGCTGTFGHSTRCLSVFLATQMTLNTWPWTTKYLVDKNTLTIFSEFSSKDTERYKEHAIPASFCRNSWQSVVSFRSIPYIAIFTFSQKLWFQQTKTRRLRLILAAKPVESKVVISSSADNAIVNKSDRQYLKWLIKTFIRKIMRPD